MKKKYNIKPKKYLVGTQELNYAPDYSMLYNAQNDVYNRRVRQSTVDNSIINPITDASTDYISNQKLKTGVQIGTTAARIGSDILNKSSYNSRGKQDEGKAVASNALKYGSMGASMGSMAGPIGTAIGGVVGTIGGGIYGAVSSRKNNRIIDQADRNTKTLNNYLQSATQTNYNYNLQGDINSEYAKAQGFARKGKYNIRLKSKSKTEESVKLHLPNPNKYKSRYSDYIRKPTR